MKHIQNILLVTMLCHVYTSTEAQIKKQFVDEQYSQTTVLVRQEGADDQTILNNLDAEWDGGLGEVIRIDTEFDRPDASNAQASQGNAVDAAELIPDYKKEFTEKSATPSTLSKSNGWEVSERYKSLRKKATSPKTNTTSEKIYGARYGSIDGVHTSKTAKSSYSPKKVSLSKKKGFQLFDFSKKYKPAKRKKYRGRCFRF